MGSKGKYTENHQAEEWRILDITSKDGLSSEMKRVETECKPGYVVKQIQAKFQKKANQVIGQCEVQDIPGSSQDINKIVKEIITNYYEQADVGRNQSESIQAFQLQIGKAKSNVFKLKVSQYNLIRALSEVPSLKGKMWALDFSPSDLIAKAKKSKFKKGRGKKKQKGKGKNHR